MTATLEGVSCQQHAPPALYPLERPGTHFTEGWVGPRAGLDRCGKSLPHRDSIPERPTRSSVAIPTELPGPYIKRKLIDYQPFCQILLCRRPEGVVKVARE